MIHSYDDQLVTNQPEKRLRLLRHLCSSIEVNRRPGLFQEKRMVTKASAVPFLGGGKNGGHFTRRAGEKV